MLEDKFTYYQIDNQSIFTNAIELSKFDPIPYGTTTKPPVTTGTQVVCWHMGKWEILPEYPFQSAPPLSATEIAAQLSTAKINKNAEINEDRLKANFSTFHHLDKTFACDQLSRSDIDGTNGFIYLYGALPPGWPGGWKAVDNTYIPITSVNDWKAFYSSMFAQGNANFLHAQSLKTRLEQATTIQEVQAITWDAAL